MKSATVVARPTEKAILHERCEGYDEESKYIFSTSCVSLAVLKANPGQGCFCYTQNLYIYQRLMASWLCLAKSRNVTKNQGSEKGPDNVFDWL